MNKSNNITQMCNMVSTIVCYMTGEFTERDMDKHFKENNIPEEVIEHIKTIVPEPYQLLMELQNSI